MSSEQRLMFMFFDVSPSGKYDHAGQQIRAKKIANDDKRILLDIIVHDNRNITTKQQRQSILRFS